MFGISNHSGPAILDSATGQSFSFGEIRELAREAVAPMGADRQLLLLRTDNSLASAVLYVGALLGGHAVALLDAATPQEVLLTMVDRYRIEWIGGPVDSSALLDDGRLRVDGVFDTGPGSILRVAAADAHPLHPDLSVLLSTSGTTGSMKFVRLSRRNVESNASSIAQYLELSPEERPITSLPMHYTFGLSVLNSHWTAGAPIVLTKASMMEESFWDTFRQYEATSLAGVPFSYLMLERIGFREKELPTLEMMVQAGGALDQRLQREYRDFMEDRGGRFFVMYGQTEATARISYVPPDRLADKLGSAGIPIPGGSFAIQASDKLSTEPGVIGELVYRGPNVMMGYATGAGELSDGDVMGGELYTGDIGRLDDEGYLFLTGRSKRIAKVFGRRVNLDEIEVRMRQHGPVAVVAEGDSIYVFCAFGEREELEVLRKGMIRDFRLPIQSLRFDGVDAIPTTTSDKVDYRKVETWIQE